jgi:two-component system response regulator FixJ
MTDIFKAHIFVVDDNPGMLDVVSLILKSAGFGCTCFISPDDCLHQLNTLSCDLLITDVKMPGKDGIELLTEAKQIIPWLPVLVITSYANIPMSVKAVKAGAFDFVEKPLDIQNLIPAVESALKQTEPTSPLRGKLLSKTEMGVLRLILLGKSNKETAYMLHRSVRTIEVHRSHIMNKLGVDNIVDLVKRATAMGLVNRI